MELKNNFLICLTGLPASGKSIFAKKLKKELSRVQNNFETIIIDTDKIRYSLYDKEFDYKKEIFVREKNLKLIEKNLIEKKIVISDDLNYYSSMRHELREITNNLNLRIFTIYIATPFNMCIEWNKKRGYTIPNSVIHNINKKFDRFQKYKWDHPDYIVDMSRELNLDKLISDIVLKMIKLDKKLNLQNLRKEINDKKKKKKYTQKLDLITRDITGYLLKDQKNCLIKNKIIEKRKEFIKLNLREIMSGLEIKTRFIKYLEISLKIKVL